MLEEKTGLGPGLVFCLVFSSIFGYGLLQAPSLAAKYIGANGYWGIITAFLLSVPLVMVIVDLTNRFPGQSAIEFLPRLLGRPAGKILGGLYLLFLLAILVWALRATVNNNRLYFLPRTPVPVVVAMILAALLYLARKGIEGISRLAAFLFPLAFIFIVANTALSFQDFRWDNIRPVLYMEPAKLAVGTIQLFNIFFPLAGLFGFAKYVTRRNGAPRAVITATGIAVAFLLLLVLAALGTYGTKMVENLTWPSLENSRQANIPYVLLTFGLFFSVVQFVQLFIGAGLIYFLIAQGCAELFGALDYKRFAYILFVPIALLVLSVGDSVRMFKFFDYLRPAGFAFLFGLILILVAASFIKHEARK